MTEQALKRIEEKYDTGVHTRKVGRPPWASYPCLEEFCNYCGEPWPCKGSVEVDLRKLARALDAFERGFLTRNEAKRILEEVAGD